MTTCIELNWNYALFVIVVFIIKEHMISIEIKNEKAEQRGKELMRLMIKKKERKKEITWGRSEG